jgi:hypothetical protein
VALHQHVVLEVEQAFVRRERRPVAEIDDLLLGTTHDHFLSFIFWIPGTLNIKLALAGSLVNRLNELLRLEIA